MAKTIELFAQPLPTCPIQKTPSDRSEVFTIFSYLYPKIQLTDWLRGKVIPGALGADHVPLQSLLPGATVSGFSQLAKPVSLLHNNKIMAYLPLPSV